MWGNTKLNFSPFLHLHCSFCIGQSHQVFFLCLIEDTGRMLTFMSCGPVFCSLLKPSFLQSCWSWWVFHGAHPSTSQVMDLSSQHIFEERRSYCLFSRFGDGRRWKKWSSGFAVFLIFTIFCRIKTSTRSFGLRYHWTFLQNKLQGVQLGSTKRDDHIISGCSHVSFPMPDRRSMKDERINITFLRLHLQGSFHKNFWSVVPNTSQTLQKTRQAHSL